VRGSCGGLRVGEEEAFSAPDMRGVCNGVGLELVGDRPVS
jgi:hypothetical protein